MANDVSTIISENPVQELWKLLRFFKDINYCIKYHCYHLGISEEDYKKHKNNKNNFEKQAKQIGYCIRQAEEYFKASAQVGLATRPNLLYYGAVSLSKALILLRKDGDYSIDYLRKKERHQHHGLDIKKTFKDIKEDIDIKAFFEKLQCECYCKQIPNSETSEKSKIPWGHFPLFYESLTSNYVKIQTELIELNKSTGISFEVRQSAYEVLPINTFLETPFNSLKILRTLPDMYFHLKRFDIQSNLCRGEVQLKVTDFYKTDTLGERKLLESSYQYYCFLNNLPNNLRNDFLNLFRELKFFEIMEEGENFLVFTAQAIINEQNQKLPFQIVDMVDDITGQIFYIANPAEYLPEPAAYLVLLFNLSIICRYYPDVWVRIIDNNIPIAEITDSLLNIIYRKFPNLILDLMTGTKHYIHS
jgi:hypothetical protein